MNDRTPLDRPVWYALGGPQSHLAVPHANLLRLRPDYGPFAAAAPDDLACLASLLLLDTDELWLVEPEAVAPPSGTRLIRSAPLVQMIADGPITPFLDPQIVQLSEGDVTEMTALALATQPGPWASQTRLFGQFYGLRVNGKIAAMAGERMRPAPEFAEVSGVCTWPEFRGQGLAARLIRTVMTGMAARGEIPFLHSYAGNVSAIRLYESLGFRPRRAMVATILGKAL